MINLYVVRHGETLHNKEDRYSGRLDIEMTSKGSNQIKKLAEKYKDLNIDAIYYSPLKRTKQVAKLLAEIYKCPTFSNENFIERSLGVYEGLTKFEAKNKYPTLFEDNCTRQFNGAPVDGETVNEVIERITKGLDKIKQSEYQNVLIVTHGFVAKAINHYFNCSKTENNFFDFSIGSAEMKQYKL